MSCARAEPFPLSRSRRLSAVVCAGHAAAAVAVLHCGWPLALPGLAAVAVSLWRQRMRPWPVRLERDAGGGWWLRRSDGVRLPARPATARLPGVTSVTVPGRSVTLFADAFAPGGERRLRALLRHQRAAVP